MQSPFYIFYTTVIVPNILPIILSSQAIVGGSLVWDKLIAKNPQIVANENSISAIKALLAEKGLNHGPTFYNMGGNSSGSVITGLAIILGIVSVCGLL